MQCADLLDYLVLEVVSEFDKLLHELLFDDDHADDVSIRQVELQVEMSHRVSPPSPPPHLTCSVPILTPPLPPPTKVIARYAIMNLQRKMEDGSSSQDRSKEKARVLESECEGLMQEIQPEIELSLGNGEEHISSFLNDTLFRNFPILDAELASLYSGLEMRPPPALHSAALVAEVSSTCCHPQYSASPPYSTPLLSTTSTTNTFSFCQSLHRASLRHSSRHPGARRRTPLPTLRQSSNLSLPQPWAPIGGRWPWPKLLHLPRR